MLKLRNELDKKCQSWSFCGGDAIEAVSLWLKTNENSVN